MKTTDFDYQLPVELIAQTPIEPRHASRLMVLERVKNSIIHTRFVEISNLLKPRDVFVINKTRVIPARLVGQKSTGGRAEILLLHESDDLKWEALVGGKNIRTGSVISFAGEINARIESDLGGSRRLVSFSKPVQEVMYRFGKLPLPPYIHKPLEDQERYQTVYSSASGSSAAPTAGLHFTHELMKILKAKGVQFVEITLHVGLDTFAPVTESEIEKHIIHREWCEVTSAAVETINRAKDAKARVIAVGTTSVRALESAADPSNPGYVSQFCGETGLFITPGYRFRVVDAMVTNFHLPKSTLLMLVSAFAGRDFILESYELAVRERYRFYSFGDAMFIL